MVEVIATLKMTGGLMHGLNITTTESLMSSINSSKTALFNSEHGKEFNQKSAELAMLMIELHKL
jgi:hypothetical protein